MARRQIIDAHHHLWDLAACHYPWLMAKGVQRFFGDPTAIQRNYLVSELQADAQDYELLGSVHIQVGVQPGDEVRETEWLQSVADEHGLPSAIVAFCDLAADNSAEVLQAHQQYERVRGVRQIVGRSMEEDRQTGSALLLENPLWLQNLKRLSGLGLSFDLQLIPPQATRVAELLAEVDDLDVAVCHCGSPGDHSDEGREAWARGMSQLASLPRAYCKISGFGMFNHDWKPQDIRYYIDTCVELFGTNRVMFGSNFPVDKLHRSYRELWLAYEAAIDGYSEVEQQRMLVGTAKAFYRL